MISKNQKLVMVSVVFKGQRKVAFVKGFVHSNGKVTVASSVINELFSRMCGLDNSRGFTYTIGG